MEFKRFLTASSCNKTTRTPKILFSGKKNMIRWHFIQRLGNQILYKPLSWDFIQPLTFYYNYFRQKVGVNVLKQPLSLNMSLDKKIHSLSRFFRMCELEGKNLNFCKQFMLIHNEQFIWIMSIWVNVVFQDTVQLSQQATIIISVEQLDSMLLRICSVKDPRWHQNVVRTKKCHTSHSRVCLWCSYYILTYSVIYHCYHPLQHRIYLLYTIKRQNVANGEVIYVTVLQQILSKNQSNCMYNSAYQKNHNFLNCRWF